MPDLITHYYFGQQVLRSLSPDIAGNIQTDIFTHTTPGPDVWFSFGFYSGKNKVKAGRGNYMHEHDTGAFLAGLACRARTNDARDELFSYLAGFLCHYSLDTTTHPYILYRTGDYDGTEATRSFRGNHMRLERAIDSYIIRHIYHLTPGCFSIAARMLPLKKLPDSLREPLDSVYSTVYGWDNVWQDLNAAIRDQRNFYRLIQDPVHLVNGLTRLVDNGKSQHDYRLMSYRGRDLDSTRVDYMNEHHALWRHPFDPAVTSTASFWDLFEMARQKAVGLVDAIYYYVYQNKALDLPSLLGNASYSTGLDCLDERNHRPGVFEPLF